MTYLRYKKLLGVSFIFLVSISFGISQSEIEFYPGGIVFPRMTTAERDALTPVIGQFIYNSDFDKVNFYDGDNWNELGQGNIITDADEDTRIEVEESADSDSIKMYANGSEVLRIIADATGRERLEIINSKFNSFFGEKSGRSNITGTSNSFFGWNSGKSNTTGTNNSFFGMNSGTFNTEGLNNSFFGSLSGRSNKTAEDNSFFGRNSGGGNSTGSRNSFFGSLSGGSNKTAEDNSFFGFRAGNFNDPGSKNSLFGTYSGFNNRSGSENAFFGYSSGHSNRAGSKNSFFGYQADIVNGADPIDNAIAIGYNAKVGCSNCIVIGGLDQDAVNLGLGTTTPIAKIHLNNKIDNDTKILFSEEDSTMASLLYEGSAGSEENKKVHMRSEIGLGENLMTWKLNGNIGIGSDDPSSKLDVNGDLNLSSGTGKIAFYEAGAEKAFISYTGQHMTFDNNETGGNINIQAEADLNFNTGGSNTSALFIDDNQHVGIGTTSPAAMLDLNGDMSLSDGSGKISFLEGGSEKAFLRYSGLDLVLENNEASGDLFLDGRDDIFFEAGDGFAFSPGGSNVRTFTIKNTGKVGIGTTTPIKMLDINGDMNLSDGTGKISFYEATTEKAFISYTGQHVFFENNEAGGDINIYAEDDVNFKTGGSTTSALFIKDNRNVGIGTTNPDSRLEVNGDISIVTGSFYDDGVKLNVPDYVFHKDYKLKNLNEVEQFILNNNHLEGFPTMHDTQGWAQMSLQKRDMKMLEKIEELFLYTIQQEKENYNLKQNIANQQKQIDELKALVRTLTQSDN